MECTFKKGHCIEKLKAVIRQRSANVVIVQFPQYIGPSFLENCSNCVPIVPIRRDWYSGKKNMLENHATIKTCLWNYYTLKSRSISR